MSTFTIDASLAMHIDSINLKRLQSSNYESLYWQDSLVQIGGLNLRDILVCSKNLESVVKDSVRSVVEQVQVWDKEEL